MRSITSAIVTLVGLAGLGAAGCSFAGVDPDGTTFSCAEPPNTCPTDFTCVEGLCRRDDLPDPPDAGDDLPDPPDAGDDLPDPPDAGDLPDPPDAAPRSLTLTFGDRADADFQDVTDDAYLDEEQTNTEFGGNIRVAVDAAPRRIGLVRFDLAGLPADAVVESAQLVVDVNDPIESGDFRAQVMTVDWDVADVTFNRPDVNQSWPTAGAGTGSFVPGDVASFAPRATGVFTVEIATAVVQAWVDDPSRNFGLRWIAVSSEGRGGEWRSSNEGDSTRRPLLRVTFH